MVDTWVRAVQRRRCLNTEANARCRRLSCTARMEHHNPERFQAQVQNQLVQEPGRSSTTTMTVGRLAGSSSDSTMGGRRQTDEAGPPYLPSPSLELPCTSTCSSGAQMGSQASARGLAEILDPCCQVDYMRRYCSNKRLWIASIFATCKTCKTCKTCTTCTTCRNQLILWIPWTSKRFL